MQINYNFQPPAIGTKTTGQRLVGGNAAALNRGHGGADAHGLRYR